jgi:2-haloacid dehalogenase
METKPKLLIFDVNETLLDLSPLKEKVNKLLGTTYAFEIWFSKLIQFAMVETTTGTYSDFGDIGASTLHMTAQGFSKRLSEHDVKLTLSLITELKPHPEVLESLAGLKENGFRLVALTNGGKATLAKQMKFSKLESIFDKVYSVEAVRKFKPHPDTYRYVLAQEQVEVEQAMLVAAHAWDIVGAHQLGLQTAFISRPGKFLYENTGKPNLVCDNLETLIKSLATHYS